MTTGAATHWWQAYAAAAAAHKASEEAKVAESKKPKSPPIPFACIRRVANGSESLCGRGIPADEHAFGDADHAVRFYLRGVFLRCCGECAEMAEKKGLVGGPKGGGQIDGIYK
jgi:hypothetical protein